MKDAKTKLFTKMEKEQKLCDVRSQRDENEILTENKVTKLKCYSIKWFIDEIEDEAKCARQTKNQMKIQEKRKKKRKEKKKEKNKSVNTTNFTQTSCKYGKEF